MNRLWPVLALGLFAAGCDRTPEAAVETPVANPDAPRVETTIVRRGYGRAVEAGDELTVHTTGWLYDADAPDHRGEKFWSSLDTGEKLTFTLGAGQMIKGWDQGLPGTLIGEVRELIIPPSLGYGESGRGPIPPNATLVFEVELFGARGPDEQ